MCERPFPQFLCRKMCRVKKAYQTSFIGELTAADGTFDRRITIILYPASWNKLVPVKVESDRHSLCISARHILQN